MSPQKNNPLSKMTGAIKKVAHALGMWKHDEDLGEERAAYAEIGRIVGIPFSTPNVCERFAAQVEKVIPFDMIVITQLAFEQNSFEIKYTFGMDVVGLGPGKTRSLEDSVVAKVATASCAIRADKYIDAGSAAESLVEAGLLSRIATPLIANDQVVGTLHVTSKVPNAYGELELARLAIVGNQIAGSIASAIQLQAANDRASQLESLYDVAAILAQPFSFEDKAQKTVDTLASIIGSDYVVLRKIDKEEKNLILVASGGFGTMEFKQELDLSDSKIETRNAYREGQAILINDYQTSSEPQPWLLDMGVESVFFIPIKSGDRTLGSLRVSSTTANYFDGRRVALITAISNEIGSLFRTVEQETKLKESREEMETQNYELTRLNQALESHYMISQIFSEFGDFNDKAKSALEMLVLLTGADWATFMLPKETTPGLHLAAAAGSAVLQSPPQRVVDKSESISTAAFAESRTIVMDDYPAFPSASPVMIAMGVKSQAFVPVKSGDSTLGLVTVMSKETNKFNSDMVDLLTFVVERFGVLVENSLLHDESEKTRDNLQILTEALADSNKQINDSNQQLEARVKIRTQELETARERAMRSERLAIIGQLSGGIAHDLRNPLGAIKNAPYLTKRKFNSENVQDNAGKIVELLELIDGEVARAEDVISNLLSYGTNKEIAFLQIEIGDVIHDSVTGIVLNDNVELSMEIEPNLPSILGDSSKLIRALQNLLVNAQDAMQDSGRNSGCLSVKAHRVEGTVEMVVADNGSGISPEILENIFEPLYTAKTQGTGLGLAICQEIINKHNGTISVDSEIGVGTTFRISIPFAVKDESESKIPISI